MKTRESWLQNGIFIYKTGLSVTKQDFQLQNRILELQTGLSPCYLPNVEKMRKNKLIYMLKLANQADLS